GGRRVVAGVGEVDESLGRPGARGAGEAGGVPQAVLGESAVVLGEGAPVVPGGSVVVPGGSVVVLGGSAVVLGEVAPGCAGGQGRLGQDSRLVGQAQHHEFGAGDLRGRPGDPFPFAAGVGECLGTVAGFGHQGSGTVVGRQEVGAEHEGEQVDGLRFRPPLGGCPQCSQG